jgi:hypothetical protein
MDRLNQTRIAINPMSKLQLLHRPWVVFDPYNKDHRKYYAEFVQYRTWGRCPVRFFVDDDSGDLITMIQRKLVDYYVTQEFLRKQQKLLKVQA